VREMSWFLSVFAFYLGCVFVATIRILDRRRGWGREESDTGGYDPEFGWPDWHEHYDSFLYLSILASFFNFPILYAFGIPFLLDEAYIQRPHEFAWGYNHFWKATAYGIFLTVIWILVELIL